MDSRMINVMKNLFYISQQVSHSHHKTVMRCRSSQVTCGRTHGNLATERFVNAGLTRRARPAGTGGEGVTLDQPPTPGQQSVQQSNRRVKWDAKRTKITQNVMNKGGEEHERVENK